MNRLLQRQLRHFGATEGCPPREWTAFLQAISEAYDATEEDRQRLERTLDLMSKELTERYEQLQKDIEARVVAEEALRASEARLRQEMSDREKMEVELRLSQKLESVGQLAAGIAHEINTPIQFVGDSIHFLKDAHDAIDRVLDQCLRDFAALPDAPEIAALRRSLESAREEADLDYLRENVPHAFERVFEGVERVASIVRAVKEFAHPDQREMAPADLNRSIQSTLTVSRNEYKYIADIETELESLPPVRCLVGDLSQVFLNLVVNAAHAIADRNGPNSEARGVIRVTSVVDGGDIVVSVSDTGSGIPEAIRDRIFDPFFTTKEVGRGTGQGLAISRSIVVEKHGGDLTFETVEGEGTTFHVRLPIDGPASQRAAA